MRRNSNRSAGTISVGLAMLTGALSMGLVVQDWYVDVNAPSCGTGTGTQVDPFCNVMDAVAAANDGDTIHIAPGTYFENVVLDRDLTLVGTGGDQVTILDGMASGSVVRVQDSGVTLRGLTLTNGATSSWGGGLSVESSYTNAHAHLFDCSIVSNSASSGAGIGIGNATSVDLTDSIVSANVAGIGGGICVAGSAGGIITSPGALTLTNSTVSGNTATGNIYVVGGGIAGGPGCSIAIANSVVSGNSSVAFSGGLGSSAGGGGIDSNSGTLTISSSTVSGNSSVGTFTQGGGIRSTYGIVAISNSLVSENASAGSSSGEGGGVFSFGSLTMTNSTVSRNSSTDPTRSGIFVFDAPSSYYYSDDLHIANTILWDNGLYPLALYGSPSGSVEHSLVEGGWAGTGNIDADPLFADPPGGDFRLLPGSPCIDAGDNLAVPQGLWVDLSGKRRFIDDPSTPDTGNPGHLLPIVDMGAHEFGLDPPRKVRDGRGVKVR